MCTNDIRRLSLGECSEAYLTDVKGKIQAHVFIFVEEDRISLLSVPGQAERIIAHLGRYIIREDVELADTTNERNWAMVVGPASEALLMDSALNLQCLKASVSLLWPGGFLVRHDGSDSLCEKVELPLIDTTSLAWTALRVESQLPLFGTDFDDSNLPQEVNRDLQAISFNKGCYLGQETVARIDALGHVNKKLILVSIGSQSVPDSGSKLMRGDTEVGSITSASWSPQLSRPLALAFVKRGANELGCEMDSSVGKGVVVAARNASDL